MFYTSRMSAYEVVQMAITGELCNPGFRYCTQWCIIYQCIIFLSLFMQNMLIAAIFRLFFVSVHENTPIRRVTFTKMAMSILMHEHINSTILAKVGNAGTKCVLNMIN